MGLSQWKITDAQIAQKGVISAPDRLVGTPQQNKAQFDKLIREAIKGVYNGLIDGLEGSSAAAQLGAIDPMTAGGVPVQTVLNGLSIRTNTADAKAVAAQGTANTANTTANAGLAKGNEAYSLATTASITAQLATSQSQAAIAVAETAIATATSAQSTATGAVATANLAYTTAAGIATIAQDALYTATQAKQLAEGVAYVFDPTTGQQRVPISIALSNVFYAMMSPITAGALDALGLTAAELDARNLTAYEFDTRARSILIGG